MARITCAERRRATRCAKKLGRRRKTVGSTGEGQVCEVKEGGKGKWEVMRLAT